jgi:hypothetical protein
VHHRRRQTLVPNAAVWEQAQLFVMEKTNTDLSVMKKQGEELQKQVADVSTNHDICICIFIFVVACS